MSNQYRYPCENCGASLEFSPGQQSLLCPYCGHAQQIGDAAQPSTVPKAGSSAAPALQCDAKHKYAGLAELPLAQGLKLDQDSDLAQAVRTMSCPNCGAKIEIAGKSHASTCPFCATPIVMDSATTRMIRPQGVLPFVLSQDQAQAALEQWLHGLWFAPSGLTAYARRGRKMDGVYSPFWTFDASTHSSYTGARGDYYYETVWVTREVNGRRQQVAEQVRKTRWHNVQGQVGRSFDDVLVLAATSLPRPITDALTPWDLSHLTAYRPEYLAGFLAESYTVALSDGHDIARQEMAAVIAMDVRRDIGGDEQRISSIQTRHDNETFKHILLPIWTAAYRYNGKSYRFVVNGQSGRVQGERPWSVWKIALAVLLALIVLGGLLLVSERGGYIDIGAGASTFAPDISIHNGQSYDSGDEGGYVIRRY